MQDPQNPEEWQEVVDCADFLLKVDSARQYGLIETDLRPDVNRCEEIIKRGAGKGFVPKSK